METYYHDLSLLDFTIFCPNKWDLIILNRPLHNFTENAIKCGRYVICADGGANRLYDFNMNILPTHVIGDMDSIRDDVKNYMSMHTNVIQDNDQDTTDLTKCILYLNKIRESILPLLIIGGFGGRLDHIFSNIISLYTTNYIVYMLDNENLLFQLYKGMNNIKINNKCMSIQCGILPILKPVNSVTTTGLVWNVTDQYMSSEKCFSSCNQIIDNEVTVLTTDPIIFYLSTSF
eukprot:GHVL01030829.1.p1 GENE.GHVL01030829.1~~GHVL01030829.1.p1  ORF type:complete len:232 (+),score=45.25 GHVL01030829.1:884-1579(+)